MTCALRGTPLTLAREQAGGPPMTVADLSAAAAAHLRRFYALDYRVWGGRF